MAKQPQPQPEVSTDALAQLTVLCKNALTLEQEIENLETKLKAGKENLRHLVEEDIPSFMSEIGVGITALTLADGTAVKVKDDVYASIPADNQDRAFTWLEKHGFGGLIKTEVIVLFGREQSEVAKKFAKAATKQGFTPELSRSVHNQTLRAFLREQLEKASKIPLDLFGARTVKVAKLTPAKV